MHIKDVIHGCFVLLLCSRKMAWANYSHSDCIAILNAYKVFLIVLAGNIFIFKDKK